MKKLRRILALIRFQFTADAWVQDDPDPGYTNLDHADGLGQVPDPVITPKA